MTRGRILNFAFVVLAAGGLGAADAEDHSLLDRCWTPQALAATQAELKPRHVRTKLDLTALKHETLPDASPVPPGLRGSIRSVELPFGEKLIALTFDLCETDGDVAGYDGPIVDLLRAQGVKATFFAGGKWMETHEERTAQLIADPNFEIGSHGLHHLDLARLSGATLTDEIADRCGLPAGAQQPARQTLRRTGRPGSDPARAHRAHALSLWQLQRGLAPGGGRTGPTRHPMGRGHRRSRSAPLGQGDRGDHPRQDASRRDRRCPTPMAAAGTPPRLWRSLFPSSRRKAISSSR